MLLKSVISTVTFLLVTMIVIELCEAKHLFYCLSCGSPDPCPEKADDIIDICQTRTSCVTMKYTDAGVNKTVRGCGELMNYGGTIGSVQLYDHCIAKKALVCEQCHSDRCNHASSELSPSNSHFITYLLSYFLYFKFA